ncbi:DUF4886 domain-containing protein [Candidatus Hydrogenedentota bacterium]
MIKKPIWLASKATLLIAVFLFRVLILEASQDEPDPVPRRVLFIGNSYTSQIRESLTHMLANSPHKHITVEFITKGGPTLRQYLSDKSTLERIKTGNWDFVVLQDQSQTPALPGKHTQSFHSSVDALSKLIRDAGAEPVLYMTWGRRDGDMKNKEVFPDFDTMQKKLADAYRSAAKRNKASLAPVGLAWSLVRQRDKTLGNDLYKADGSHPSFKGACLASCVFFRVLFHDSLESIQRQDTLKTHEWQIIRDAALNIDMSHNKPDAGGGK